MKLSEQIKSKVDKQRAVGHQTAAIIDYDMLNCWIDEARELEQKLNLSGIGSNRPSWEKCSPETCTDLGVEKELCECYQAACASGGGGTIAEGGVDKWCDSCGKVTKWIDGECVNWINNPKRKSSEGQP